jgi:YVTN family beta-propeller protein
VNSVTNQVFVAQYLWDNGSQTAVIDGATDTLLAPISTGRRPQDMAVDSVANRVYVVNDNASVSVLDAASGVRQTTISTGHSAISVATHAKANRVYTGNGDDTVSVFDSFASSLLTSVALPAGSGPVGLVVNSDANRLYTANALGATISVIDTSTNRLLQTSFAGGRPVGLALNPQTNRLYAANIDDSVSVINTVTNALVTLVALPAGSGPVGAAANPMTNFVYIANYGGSVSVLDGATNSVITNVALPADSCPTGVAVNPITNRVYTANRLGDSVTVIDGATNSVITTVQLPFGTEPLSVVVNTSTNRIYTCNHGIGLITVIDGATNAIVSMLGWSYSSYEGYGIALNETTGRLYTTMGAYNDVVDITQAASAGPAVVVSMTDSPKTNDTVTATAVSYGPPGDSLAMSYRWKRNDVTVRTVDSTASLTDSLDLSVPGAGDRGDTISVQVTPSAGSDTGLPASASVVVANTPPVAYARFVTTKPNTPVDVTPYVTDADNDPLTFSLTSLPSHGSLSGVATGSLWSHVVYSPYSGYSGPDAFAFYVADGTDSSQAIISINVTSSNLYTFTDVSTALRIAAGLSSIAPIDFIRFNADATGGSANSIDIADAVHLVRKVAGLEPNP